MSNEVNPSIYIGEDLVFEASGYPEELTLEASLEDANGNVIAGPIECDETSPGVYTATIDGHDLTDLIDGRTYRPRLYCAGRINARGLKVARYRPLN
jgi:hypothetical protein